jgi:putative transposase
VATVPPTLLISDFIGQLKGGSSHDVNHLGLGNAKALQWQAGYGVVSFGTGDLPWVVAYVQNQRAHHAGETVHDRLERITCDEDAEFPVGYVATEKTRERA